jgi:hypothetical protein
VVLALGAVLLAACGFGDTGPPTDVTDVGAKLTGTVHNTTVEPTDYWFDYGTSTNYDRAIPHQTVNVTSTSSGYPVSSMLGGLDEQTTYHYRLCTRGASGFGTCGGDATFTTTTGRDSVSGTGTVFSLPDIGYTIGASAFVTSGPDGASPVRAPRRQVRGSSTSRSPTAARSHVCGSWGTGLPSGSWPTQISASPTRSRFPSCSSSRTTGRAETGSDSYN